MGILAVMLYVKYNLKILAIQIIECYFKKGKIQYYNKYKDIRSCLPHNNNNDAIKILFKNSYKKVSSHIVFALNVFYFKNKTLQSQYLTHDTRAIKFRNL